MKHILHYLLFCLFLCTTTYAQDYNTLALDTISITDVRLQQYIDTVTTYKRSEKNIQKQVATVTEILQQHSTIHFKENGLGMVSSPSFRGTNASQTSIVWNGISINSPLTGQVDFNNLSLSGVSSISLKNSGGSVFYGSGAIGGSVHLQHLFNFKKQLNHQFTTAIGSYENYIQEFSTTKSNKKHYINAYAKHQNAKNNYPFLDTPLFNDNGNLTNTTFGMHYGYKPSKKNEFKVYANYFTSERELSRTLYAPSNSKLDDVNHKIMGTWQHQEKKTSYTLKLARLHENFTYYNNKNKLHLYTGSKAISYITAIDIIHKYSRKIHFHSAIDAKYIQASGDDIIKNTSKSIAGIVAFTHLPYNKLQYSISIRKEYNNQYQVPFVGNFTAKFKMNNAYTMQFNASKNYRTPTANDLFWNGLGNPDVLPETAYQASFSNKLKYKGITANLSGFYIASDNMIKWTPNTDGIWQAQNISKVNNYGLEASLTSAFKVQKHLFNLSSHYSYTKAIDQKTNKQLIYVPIHKLNATIHYKYKALQCYYEQTITDRVFTTTDHQNSIAPYTIANIGLSYAFSIQKHQLQLTGKLKNIFNKNYELTAARPMPNTNYLLYLTFNFN